MRALSGQGLGTGEIELGYVSGIFGVRGEVRLFLHNPESELFDRPRTVVLIAPDGARHEARLRARSGAGKRVIGVIDGVRDRDEAAALMEWRIAIPADELPEPEPGEFYVADLIGLAAELGGREVGRIAAVHATPAGDVLEIATPRGPEFVAAVERWVLEVDLEGGRVRLADDALEAE